MACGDLLRSISWLVFCPSASSHPLCFSNSGDVGQPASDVWIFFVPPRQRERGNAQRFGHFMHEDARLLAHRHMLEHALLAVAFGLLWSKGAQGTFSPLGWRVHKSQARLAAVLNDE